LNTSDRKVEEEPGLYNTGRSGAPKMKGNIGALNKKAIGKRNLNFNTKQAQELDIDNVIPNLGNKDHNEKENYDSESFKVSINDEYDLNSGSSVTGLQFNNKTALYDERPSGLISSDSDFEAAQQEAGYNFPPMNSTDYS
jgi:hypothetical protein